MRGLVLLHATFIFFSSILAYFLVPTVAIALFVVGFFFMFMAIGAIYRLHVQRMVLFSLTPTLLVVLVIFGVLQIVPPISLAIGLLDIFYVLQSVFWPFTLTPIIARQYYVYEKHYSRVASTFSLSILAMFLSLFVAAMLIYASIYLAFCIVLLHVLEKEYGSEGIQTPAKAGE